MKKRNIIAIKLEKVTKKYTLHHEKPTFIENVIGRGSAEQFVALKDISLTINKGEKIGIIGSNGSGKTTLLKVIVGITTPNSGAVSTQGKIVSLIDIEAGFHPDLTGEENIFLNGLLLGMDKDEVKKKFLKIVAFANIRQFIDAPLYTYSSGMKMRLGFAIAVHANPDILILDEGILTGDQDFQAKLSKKINKLFKQQKTILVVTHWLDFLRQNCEKIIWIDKGKIKQIGNVSILDTYAKQ